MRPVNAEKSISHCTGRDTTPPVIRQKIKTRVGLRETIMTQIISRGPNQTSSCNVVSSLSYMLFVLQFRGQIREPEGQTETAPKRRQSVLRDQN